MAKKRQSNSGVGFSNRYLDSAHGGQYFLPTLTPSTIFPDSRTSTVFDAVYNRVLLGPQPRSWVSVLSTYTLYQRQRVALQELSKDVYGSNVIACVPFGLAAYAVVKRACHRPLFCPFCWARSLVLPTYNQLYFGLFFDSGPQRRLIGSHQLLCGSQNWLFKPGTAVEAVMTAQTFLTRIKQELRPSVGYVAVCSIDPLSHGLRLQAKFVAAYEKSVEPPVVLPKIRLNKIETVRPYLLREITSDLCCYPVGLLTEPAEVVLPVLQARSGERGKTPRLTVSSGIFRNRSERLRRAEELGLSGTLLQ